MTAIVVTLRPSIIFTCIITIQVFISCTYKIQNEIYYHILKRYLTVKTPTIIFASHYTEILKIIEENEEIDREETYKKLNGSKTTKVERVNDLIEIGYIHETKKGRHNRKTLSLTDKGKNCLESIKKIIDGEETTNYGTPETTWNTMKE